MLRWWEGGRRLLGYLTQNTGCLAKLKVKIPRLKLERVIGIEPTTASLEG